LQGHLVCLAVLGLYHVAVHALAERVLAHIRRQELLHAGDRVGVAVSGGIDSVALLRLLFELRHELGIVLSVVHFNHKLRGAESDADQEFVANLARAHDLEFFCDSDDVAGHAADEHLSMETAAREMRYRFFRRLLREDQSPPPLLAAENAMRPFDCAQGKNGASDLFPSNLTKITTGHTLDDQAETVLMRLIRGTGLRGLGGIYPRIAVEDADGEVSGEIIRPLLGIRHRDLEQYLAELKQPWREDATNADARFTRNRVRQLVVPLLEREFNPAVAQNLAELAEIARGEEDYWENEASGWLGTTVQWSEPACGSGAASGLVQIGTAKLQPLDSGPLVSMNEPELQTMNASVNRVWLLTEPLAVQRRLVKAIGEAAGIPLEFKHVEEILQFATEDGPGGKELSLPLGWKVAREPESLVFLAPDPHAQEQTPQDYEYELTLPGRAMVPETGTVIEALRMPPEAEKAGYNREHLLDSDLLGERLRVRNWRPGDRFWPAHTKSPKKIKELLQERHVAAADRKLWPVVLNGDNIVWVRGFAVPAALRAKPGRPAVVIRETVLAEE
jgi:tRNA(Ile)-lysidine synthase